MQYRTKNPPADTLYVYQQKRYTEDNMAKMFSNNVVGAMLNMPQGIKNCRKATIVLHFFCSIKTDPFSYPILYKS